MSIVPANASPTSGYEVQRDKKSGEESSTSPSRRSWLRTATNRLAFRSAAQEQNIGASGSRIEDRHSFETWVKTQDPKASLVVAARATLRSLPRLCHRAADRPTNTTAARFSETVGAEFRSAATARVAAKYQRSTSATAPVQADHVISKFGKMLSPSTISVLAAVAGAGTAIVVPGAAPLVVGAAVTAARGARWAFKAKGSAAANVVDAVVTAANIVDRPSEMWDEVRADARALAIIGVSALNDAPLWTIGWPEREALFWTKLQAAMPQNHDWDVWIEWYEERLRGESRGEDYELVFASVPQEEWDTGPAAANAWIKAHLPPRPDASQKVVVPEIKDFDSLETWLKGRSREVAIAINARAALRVAPIAVRAFKSRGFRSLVLAVFRANASARLVSKYSSRVDAMAQYASGTAAAAAANALEVPDQGYDPSRNWLPSEYANARAARHVASGAALACIGDNGAADAAATAAGYAAASDDNYPIQDAKSAHDAAAESIWQGIRSDAAFVERADANTISDLPLWSGVAPDWLKSDWVWLQSALPKGEDWDVWLDWYEERLRGGSRGEAYELVFASVPQNEWEKDPAAANAWIKAHLPKAPEAARPVELLTPLLNLEAPFAYGWTASQRVAVVAGAQNLPFYPHFSSEEEHRYALEACRLGGERALKTLRSGRYNARPEYGEALEYYLDDLPKAAGAGNILLANDQIRILHAMFLADAAMLSEGLASRLKSVIANQFALNAFYDLVQRHHEAVSAGNWTQPFPLEAAKGFFSAVEKNTPRWFEREVEQGLRQVEQAAPPGSSPEPAPTSAIEPPPLPPGTPDPQDSWKRQMATSANALWETFLQGRDMPVDEVEWRAAAAQLGEHVRPILEFLREQEER